MKVVLFRLARMELRRLYFWIEVWTIRNYVVA
jgi:hypothetical protein